MSSALNGSGEESLPSTIFPSCFLKVKVERHERDSVNANNGVIENMGHSPALNIMLSRAGGTRGTYLLINTPKRITERYPYLRNRCASKGGYKGQGLYIREYKDEIEEIFVIYKIGL